MKRTCSLKEQRHGQITWWLSAFALILSGLQGRGASGDVDLSFNPGSTINGYVQALALQEDGKVIVGGDFTTVHDAIRNRIARLNADGTTDLSFTGGVTRLDDYAYVQCLALQSDGKIVVGGWFTEVNGIVRTNLARLNTNGSVDTTFLNGQSGVNNSVEHLVVQNDGRILVGGWFASVNGIARTNLARLNNDGSVDDTFSVALVNLHEVADPEPGAVVGLALQEDGRILIGGAFTSVNGVARTNIARLNADGTLDESFSVQLGWHAGDSDEPGYAGCFSLQSDGSILVGGSFTLVNGVARTNLVRLHNDGSVDESFACPEADANEETYQIVARPDGKLVACGSFTPDGLEWWNVVLLNINGPLDTTFNNSFPAGRVLTVAVQADGKVVVGGDFWTAAGATRRSIARLQNDGAVDSAFNNGGPVGVNYSIGCMAVQTDGKVLIGGQDLNSVNGQPHRGIARLNPDGSLDESFMAGVGGAYPYLCCVSLQGDGKILLGGQFSMVNGVSRNGVARLNPDGTLDTGFLDGLSGANGTVLGVTVDANSRVVVCGNFDQINGQTNLGLARLNPDGSFDTGFANEAQNFPVRAIAVQSDGKVLAAGGSWLERFNADGSRDPSLVNGPGGPVLTMAVQPDGRIIAGGTFQQPLRSRLARLKSDGALDPSFLNGMLGPDNSVQRVALEADGKILIAGNFTSVNGIVRRGLARLQPDGSLDSSFDVDLHNASVSAIAVQPDTKILIAGWFTAVNQTARACVARLMGSCVAPAIQSSPNSRTGEAGDSVTFNVVADGFPALCYQWFFNGTNLLVGCTNHALELADVQDTQSGSYCVVISNAGGSLTSGPVMLSVIVPVERRPVPAINLFGEAGVLLNLDFADSLDTGTNWLPLETVSLISTSKFYFDLASPLPPQRFYRAWQTGNPSVLPSLSLPYMVPAITLTGNSGDTLRLDYINAIGPTDAWVTLDTITLTNASQLYFDDSAPGQPRRLYRIVPVP